MTLEFLCPNGHPIRCGDEQAGRVARCPKCEVKFRIPKPEELTPGQLTTAVAIQKPPERPPDEEQIQFLCPNGHLLFGPRRLQGRAGQCPECGVKFRIPSYDEINEEETPAEQELIQVSRKDEQSATDIMLEQPPQTEPLWDDSLEGIGQLMVRLWERKTVDTPLELELEDGSTFTPDHFLPASAACTHGLFATEEPDGTYTLLAIAWSSIRRVHLRSLSTLPSDFQG